MVKSGGGSIMFRGCFSSTGVFSSAVIRVLGPITLGLIPNHRNQSQPIMCVCVEVIGI